MGEKRKVNLGERSTIHIGLYTYYKYILFKCREKMYILGLVRYFTNKIPVNVFTKCNHEISININTLKV